MKFSINLLWSASLVLFFKFFFFILGLEETRCRFVRVFSNPVLLSHGFITHPLLLTVYGLRQIPCHRQPTRWIKTKANPRLLLSFPPLLISPHSRSQAAFFSPKWASSRGWAQLIAENLHFARLRPLDGHHAAAISSCYMEPLTLKCQFVLDFFLLSGF